MKNKAALSRRHVLTGFALGCARTLATRHAALAQSGESIDRGNAPVRIRKVRAITTAPDGIRLVVVKVETDEPGLYGLGCATFNQRPLAVVEAVNKYLASLIATPTSPSRTPLRPSIGVSDSSL